MKSMIKELYWGNLNLSDQTVTPNSPYQRAMEIMTEKEEKLLEILSEDDKELFHTFIDSQMDINEIMGVDKFSLGFIIGARLMLEVMYGKGL